MNKIIEYVESKKTDPNKYSKRERTCLIVGGGILGAAIAIQVAEQAHKDNIECRVQIYEPGVFGGSSKDEWTAGPRCQLWHHKDGQLYAKSRPDVTLALKWSTRWFHNYVPSAFKYPLAWAIEQRRGEDEPALGSFYRALDIPYQSVSLDIFQRWYPELSLPPDCQIYRISDGVMDIQRLSYGLMKKAIELGVEWIDDKVEGLDHKGDKVCLLKTANSGLIKVTSDDQVVLACGSRIRSLMAGIDIIIPALRHFQCHLIATDVFNLSALFVMHGITNCIPHPKNGRQLNIFGNGHRLELPPEADNRRLQVDLAAVELVCQDVEKWFGLQIPKDNRYSWFGVKTEIVPETGNSLQAHHVLQVPGLSNAWLSIPGKLSQTPACGRELAEKILGRWINEPIARPIWDDPSIITSHSAYTSSALAA